MHDNSLKYSVEKILPIYCAFVAYKTIYNYFIYLFPALQGLWVLLYNLITMFGLVAFIPLAFYVLFRIRRHRMLIPALIIPLCVIINIFVVMIQTGDMSIISRDYRIIAAIGTNDEYGLYFSQINVWFGNMSVILMLALFTSKKETIIKCVVSSLFVLFIPAALMVVMHPEFLGVRQSTVEGSDVVFGGGLWNIGVMGIGSVSWLGISLIKDMTKRQQLFVIISVVFLAFVGLAGLSRTLVLMLVLSIGYYFLKAKKNAGWLLKLLLMVIVLALFAVLEWDIISSIIFRFEDSSSGTQNIRFLLWRAYLSHFKEVWLFGAPLGSVYNYYYDVELIGDHFLPHSSIINFLIRFGLVCAISYLVLIKNAFLKIKPNASISADQTACIRAGCVAYISLAFVNQTGYGEPIFYIMFGLLLAYTQINRNAENGL